MNELRRFPRLDSPKGTILAWSTVGRRRVSSLKNIGLGGMFIRALDPPPPGSSLQVLLEAPLGEIRARAVVQRVRPNAGMGVRFVAMQPEDRARLGRWLSGLMA